MQTENGAFDGGPQIKLERHLRLCGPGQSRIARRALIVVLVGWAPLILLAAIQSTALHMQGLGAFLWDAAVHARSLIAATCCGRRTPSV
jgi:hypothetical protein